MKFWTLVAVFGLFTIVTSKVTTARPQPLWVDMDDWDHLPPDECRDDEYNPGLNCGTEPICPVPSSHYAPRTACKCWCKPGTFRVISTLACVPYDKCATYT